jgi:hypothetical protein
MKKMSLHKVIIGRAELMHFVTLNIVDVPAKIDTGAYRSAIHADNIKENSDGTLEFRILGNHPVCGKLATIEKTKNYKKVWVSNSFGHREERYEVKLKIKLGVKIVSADFTLANRSKKIYPILVGRKLLNGRFIIDTSQTSVNRIELKKQFGIILPQDEEGI